MKYNLIYNLNRSNNDIVVQDSIRTFLEYKQMENRVRLDLPTLSDNYIRDLLQESDLFVRSFTGSGGFGLLSPRDFVNIAALLSELIAQIYILISLTSAPAHLWALALAFLSAVLPTIVKWCGLPKLGPQLDEDLQWRETDASLHQERIRNMALNETHRPEMILFGLGPAMLKQWYGLRVAASRQNKRFQRDGSALQTILSQLNVSEMTMALQSVSHAYFFTQWSLFLLQIGSAFHDHANLVDISWFTGTLSEFRTFNDLPHFWASFDQSLFISVHISL